MKLRAMAAAVLVAACGSAHAGGGNKQTVVVYIVNDSLVPVDIRIPGEAVATRMFAEIGVHLEWRHRQPVAGQAQREQALVIEISGGKPDGASQDALASAQPFEGSAITIYYQSLKWAEHAGRLAPQLFAHVLAHEIGHNLQRTNAHSHTGVMKAHWTTEDFSQMGRRPLRFEDGDVASILAGLAARNTPGATLTSAK